MQIIEITGDDLKTLLNQFETPEEARGKIRTVRVAIDEETFMVKVNGWTWSPPLGAPT